MAFGKITSDDTQNKGVIGLPDTPNLSTAGMQEKLDELALDVIIPKFNALITALGAVTAAANVGAVIPSGISSATAKNVQSVLEAMGKLIANIQKLVDSANATAGNALTKANSANDNASTALQTANAAVQTANTAVSKIDGVVAETEQAIDDFMAETEQTIIGYAFMVDPITGKYLPINQIVENLYDSVRPAPLTADQYRALQLTANQYASYQITAHDYAYYGANILGK